MTGENKNEFYVEIWWILREGTAGLPPGINKNFVNSIRASIQVYHTSRPALKYCLENSTILKVSFFLK